MPQPATGTARKSESVAQLVVPAPKGVDAGSNPARLTSHAQPRDYVRYTLLFESGSCAAMGRSVSDAACGN